MIPKFINRWLPDDEKSRAQLFTAVAFVLGLLCSPVASFVMNGTMASFQERGSFYNKVAEIESYRALPDSVKCSPQVANTIAGWNARIAVEHESNRHIITDFFSSDAWNAVQPIVLHCA